MRTRWPNQTVKISKGTLLMWASLWLAVVIDEPAFAGMAVIAAIWMVASAVADSVDRRNALRDES